MKIIYDVEEIDLNTKWKRVHMVDIVNEYTGVNFYDIETVEEARAAAKEHNVEIGDNMLYGHILNEFFEQKVEEELRSEEHTSELQSRFDLVCRLLLEKKKK